MARMRRKHPLVAVWAAAAAACEPGLAGSGRLVGRPAIWPPLAHSQRRGGVRARR